MTIEIHVNTLCMAVVQSLVLALAFGPVACGGPTMQPAVDLGAEKVPAEAAIVFTNTTSAPVSVFIKWSAGVDSVPDDGRPRTSDQAEVEGVLVAGSVYPPGASTGELVIPVFLYHVVRYTVETWDPATGEERRSLSVNVPGRAPALLCSVALSIDGLTKKCE